MENRTHILQIIADNTEKVSLGFFEQNYKAFKWLIETLQLTLRAYDIAALITGMAVILAAVAPWWAVLSAIVNKTGPLPPYLEVVNGALKNPWLVRLVGIATHGILAALALQEPLPQKLAQLREDVTCALHCFNPILNPIR